MKLSNIISFVFFSVILVGWVDAARADSNFDSGVQLYNQGNFGMAAKYFDTVIVSSPGNTTAVYYDALCYQQLQNLDRAKLLYLLIQKEAPNSQVAKLATMALQGMNSSAVSNNVANYGSSSSSNDILPDETKIYFVHHGNSIIIDAEINNRPIKMIFDTGASGCVIGKNQLQELAIHPPEGQATGASLGVGSSGSVKMWDMRVDLKVGGIVRRSFPLMVQDQLSVPPLLGQTFFKDYQYSIDDGAQSITFKRKGASVARDNYAVPFVREGNEMVVNVEVNGHQCSMYFDTGASGIVFSPSQISMLGISVPEDATAEASIGIGGVTAAKRFVINRMKMGPIDRSDMPVSVVEQSAMGKPLLGQSFVQGWQYTIDNSQHLIHFVRR